MNRARAKSSARLLGRILRHHQMRERTDYVDIIKLKVTVTKRCNLHCRQCGMGSHPGERPAELDAEQINRIWQRNPRLQIVSLSGGEPFLRTDLEEITRAAFSNLPDLLTYSINTNGYFTERVVTLAEKLAPFIPAQARLHFMVSSDGPEAVHNDIRGHKQSFARKEDTLKQLRELRRHFPQIAVHHNFNLNRWNLDVAPEYIEQCEARGERVTINLYSTSPHYLHTPEQVEEVQRFHDALKQRPDLWRRLQLRPDLLGNRFLTLAQSFYETQPPRQPLPCMSLRASVLIEPDGSLQPCINYPVVLGNVLEFDGALEPLLALPKSLDCRRLIREQRCPICWSPSQAYMTMLCGIGHNAFWRSPLQAVRRLNKL